MQVEQYVMAYGIEQDRIRAIIPDGFVSLRPVLRINAEIQDNSNGYLEFNTPVEKDNAGCYFLKETPELKKPETITENKEFCDCTFQWKFTEKDAHGVSIGKTLPSLSTRAGNDLSQRYIYSRKCSKNSMQTGAGNI